MGATDAWLIQVRKGVVELLTLRLLARDGELHGYAIVKELQAFGGLISGGSTVYPVLKRLEADGLLAARWVESSEGPPRRYYSVSASGLQFLREANAQWEQLVADASTLRGNENDG